MGDDEAAISEAIPVTTAQRDMWMTARLAPSSPTCRIGEYLEIHGPVDAVVFERAVRRLVEESEALRARFVERDGEILQLIESAPDWTFHVIDVSAHSDPVAGAERWMRTELQDPMRPETGPLFTFALFVLSDDRFAWYTGYHHLVADGVSARLVAARVAELYTALIAGEPPAPSPFATVRELVNAEQAYQCSEQCAADRAYWKNRLAEPPEPARLVGNPTRPSDAIVRSADHLGIDDVEAMRNLAARARFRLTSLVPVAATAAFLHRMTGQTDIVLGFPVTARPTKQLRRLPGPVSNVVPLRIRVRPDTTVGELLEATRVEVREALAHQRYRSSWLCQDLNIRGGLAGLVSMSVNLMPFDKDLTIGGHQVTVHLVANNPIHDMALFVYNAADSHELRVFLQGNDELHTAEELTEYHSRFTRFLRGIAATELDQPIGSIDLLDPNERDTLLKSWGRGVDPINGPRTITELFAAQCAVAPNATAIVANDHLWTYRQIDQISDRLAAHFSAHLTKRQGNRESCVALALPRGVDLVVAILAVLKSGAAYLLLDPDQPTQRIRYLLDDARPDLLVTTSPLTPTRYSELEVPSTTTVLRVEDLSADFPARIKGRSYPECAACVIYTSGSTGRPKGVVLTNRNIVEMVLDPRLVYGHHDRVLLHSPMTFDAFSHELWTPLLTGRTVVIAPPGRLDITDIGALIARHHITSMFATAALFAILAQEAPESLAPLHEIWTGGEAVSADAVRQLQAACPDLDIIHAYGPAENTTFATAHLVKPLPPSQTTVPIGRPVAGTQVYVVDAGSQLVPPGVPGELYIAGTGLARGYLNQPDLTARKFVANLDGGAGRRMYRTGDRVRWNRQGELEFLGRTDDQVKVRGFRIEPAEIQAMLTRHPGVRTAAVVPRRDPSGTNHLVAYVAPDTINPEVLRAFLAESLPDYMIPTAIIGVDILPLTANGKLDHNSLPTPRFDTTAASRPPHTATEKAIAGLFAEILGVTDVGVDDDFFRLGGHSILAMRLAARVRYILGVNLDIRDVFATPTVAGLAERLSADVERQEPPTGRDAAERLVLRVSSEALGVEVFLDTDLVAAADDHADRIIAALAPLVHQPVTEQDLRDHPIAEQFADVVRERHRSLDGVLIRSLNKSTSPVSPLYLVHPAGGDSAVYASIARLLEHARPCYGLDRVDTEFNIDARAREYTKLLHQPGILGGWSSGGLAAFEAACQMEAAGAAPRPVVLLDTTLPPWERSDEDRRRVSAQMLGALAEYFTGLYSRPIDLDIDLLAAVAGPRQVALFRNAFRRSGIGDIISPGLLRTHIALVEDTAAMVHYRPRKDRYSGPVVLFRAINQQPWVTPAPDDRPGDPALGWGDHCHHLTIVHVPGNHFDIVEPESAKLIAQHLTDLFPPMDGHE